MKTRILYIVILSITILSCEKEKTITQTTDLSAPIIKTNDFFSSSNWNDPHVIKVGSKFIMYASASRNFDFNIKIYRLESEDGIKWHQAPSEAVFEKSSNQNDWDSKSVETPAVTFYKGQYHLFYTAYNTQYDDVLNFKIGHATSIDGIVWTRDQSFLLVPTAPNESPNLDFNQYVVAEPAPVVFNDNLYLYFTAMGANATVNTTLQVIGLTIFDGTSWSTPVSVLEPNQNIYPRSEYVGYSTPNAIVIDGKINLYFDVAKDNPWQQVKIHHAVSSDGIHNWITDATSILNKEDYIWTEDEIRSPSVIQHDNKTYLYFAGHKGLELGIGLKILQ